MLKLIRLEYEKGNITKHIRNCHYDTCSFTVLVPLRQSQGFPMPPDSLCLPCRPPEKSSR